MAAADADADAPARKPIHSFLSKKRYGEMSAALASLEGADGRLTCGAADVLALLCRVMKFDPDDQSHLAAYQRAQIARRAAAWAATDAPLGAASACAATDAESARSHPSASPASWS
jgi:hypothetical protein